MMIPLPFRRTTCVCNLKSVSRGQNLTPSTPSRLRRSNAIGLPARRYKTSRAGDLPSNPNSLSLSSEPSRVATGAVVPPNVGSSATPIDIPIPTSLWYQRLGPVSDFFSWFNRTQNKRPYTVQLCSSLTVYLVGDLLAQDIGGERYDPARTMRMLFIGATTSIPGYKWFLFLGNHFNYASKTFSVATKVAVQQAVFTPIFNTYFFGMQAILVSDRPSAVIERIRRAVPESIKSSVKFWPAVTAFSFAFILPQYRFMFAGCFAVAWQGYLSFLNRREEKKIVAGVGGSSLDVDVSQRFRSMATSG